MNSELMSIILFMWGKLYLVQNESHSVIIGNYNFQIRWYQLATFILANTSWYIFVSDFSLSLEDGKTPQL